MFTGIVEATGRVVDIQNEVTNRRFTIEASFAAELKPDQSVAHNGVCLTVESISGNTYQVVAIKETLHRSNFQDLKIGDYVNLERSLKVGDRLDGHFVQGHVDQTAICKNAEALNGSWLFTFHIEDQPELIVEKGSITINGVSLTVTAVDADSFSVAIIPYTYEHTNFKTLKKSNAVNIEFDVLGKYVKRIMEGREQSIKP